MKGSITDSLDGSEMEIIMKIKNVNISKLNFSLLVSTGVIVILALILVILLAGRANSVSGGNEVPGGTEPSASGDTGNVTRPTGPSIESITYDDNEFTEEVTEAVSTLMFNVHDDGSILSRPTYISAQISSSRYWNFGDTPCTQFNVVIKNVSGRQIDNWGIVIEFNQTIKLLDYWNANMELQGEDIKITPVAANQKVGTSDEFSFGFILSSPKSAIPESYKVIVGDKIQQIRLNHVAPTESRTPHYNENTSSSERHTTPDKSTTPERHTTPDKNTTTYNRHTDPGRDTTTNNRNDSSDRETTTQKDDMTTADKDNMTTSGEEDDMPGGGNEENEKSAAAPEDNGTTVR